MSKKEKVGGIVNFGETPKFKKSDISTDEIDSAAKKYNRKVSKNGLLLIQKTICTTS